MEIQQWEDRNLSVYSYGILSESSRQLVLIDPERNPDKYLKYAKVKGAVITAIIETHPHADYISGHLELSQITGASIYTSSMVGVYYPFQPFDEGSIIEIGEIRLAALNTPGHSPDSICILMKFRDNPLAVFTGDTLFIGDCGRPDLREGAGNIKATRDRLSREMYHSLRNKLAVLPGEVKVYPGHGAGSLCGKTLGKANSSTIAAEKLGNWSLQKMTEDEFVQKLLSDQPFTPAYFPFDVELNRKGAPPFSESVRNVEKGEDITDEQTAGKLEKNIWIVDSRSQKQYKKGHLPHSVNVMEGSSFETWLGSIIQPEEKFYLGGESPSQLKRLTQRVAAIGYEAQIVKTFVIRHGSITSEKLDVPGFKKHKDEYTILDVRNPSERKNEYFPDSLFIPLNELRKRINEIPTDKPIVVHCSGGYRSAAGSSIIQSELNGKAVVYDLGEAVKK